MFNLFASIFFDALGNMCSTENPGAPLVYNAMPTDDIYSSFSDPNSACMIDDSYSMSSFSDF
ncbi:hypothetical protein [Pseudomonas sp. UBA7530]|uniref:hypothetical protein n=1 Tax=Pseudomonas sp. UBA7530 TaxID=1947341 RepID=UPI0025D8E281|nr:hypothetical protein [Pseudomonas sp. UBA7530]